MAKASMRTLDNNGVAAPEQATAATEILYLKDRDGRSIGVRTLSVLEEMRLLKILGEYNSSYYNFCAQVARIVEIDGQRVYTPNSEREIEVIATRLGKAGVAALMEGIVAAATQESDEKENEQIKK